MASQLSQAKVQTTLIADSAVFAMMARVNKVGAAVVYLRVELDLWRQATTVCMHSHTLLVCPAHCLLPAHLSCPLFCWQVLVGAHAVLANGGVIAPAGVHMVALAAKRHSVPFVVLVGLHKLSPLFPHDPDVTYNGRRQKPCTLWPSAVLGRCMMCPKPCRLV
jgi:hypothetical protein